MSFVVKYSGLSHPRGSGFRFDKRCKAITHVKTKKRVPGIIDELKDRFYPDYSFAKATLTDSDLENTFETEGRGTKSTKFRCKTQGALRNKCLKRGNLLDAQMGRTMGYFKRFKLPHAYFYDESVRNGWTKTVVPEAIKKYIDATLSYTKVCWMTLEQLGLCPVAHQVVVGCLRMGKGTLLDMVCIDQQKRYMVCEFKSGFQSYYYKWTGKYMQAPFQKQTDCVFNQHQLQVLASAELYRRSYWEGRSDKMATPILMRFREKEDGHVVCDVRPLRDWAKAGGPAAFQRLGSQ